MVEPDQALSDAYAAWVADDVGGMSGIARDQFGVEDPEALFASFRAYVEKWTGLMRGVDRTDPQAVYAVMKSQIYDTLDVNTYGMN